MRRKRRGTRRRGVGTKSSCIMFSMVRTFLALFRGGKSDDPSSLTSDTVQCS